MRVFITGGAGFVGRHLIKSLLLSGHSVTIYDDFSNSDRKVIPNLQKKGVKIVEGTITNKNEIINAIKRQQVVIHLAAKISVSESIKNPEETMHVNVDGTLNILEASKKNQVKNIILVSSAAVYGDADSPKILMSEESKTNPLSPYGKSKLIMEQKVKAFAEKNKINCLILRVFNIYGEGQNDEYSGVITKFATRIQNNMPLMIHGDGLQTRDFVSIDDVVAAITNAISVSGKYGSIYNIGSGKSITIKDLASLMIKSSGKKLGIEFSKPKDGDIRFSQASIKRAKNELGYVVKISLDEGIRNFLRKYLS